MINFLFLLATATASDVYEICRLEKQKWSDQKQVFETNSTRTYVSYQSIQIILHENTFEVDREAHIILNRFKSSSGLSCWRENKNSFLCYDKNSKSILWEWSKRNGDIHRDILRVCKLNGEGV